MFALNDIPARRQREVGDMRLRAIEPDDLAQLKEWRNDLKDFYREYRFINQPHQERWYETIVGDVRYVYYAIDVWDGKWWLVGSCGWCWIDWLNRHADLSIYIGDPEWRGRGVGLKAMVELHRIAFDELNLNTVRLECLSLTPPWDFMRSLVTRRSGAIDRHITTGGNTGILC